MALPRKGLSGVEKMADTTAWTNSMAESGSSPGQGSPRLMSATSVQTRNRMVLHNSLSDTCAV